MESSAFSNRCMSSQFSPLACLIHIIRPHHCVHPDNEDFDLQNFDSIPFGMDGDNSSLLGSIALGNHG